MGLRCLPDIQRPLAAFSLLILLALACNAPTPGGTAEPNAPSVTILAPADGARVQLGGQVIVESVVTHPNGVARVELWVDGAKYRSDPSPTNTIKAWSAAQPWSASLAGTHTLEVRVFSASDIAAASARITLEVTSDVAALTASPPGGTATPGPSPTASATATPTPTGTPTATPTATPGGGLVLVPAGPFIQGSDKETDEQPARQVTLAAFLIDRTEVTVADFKAFVAATGYRSTAETRGDANNWRQFDAGAGQAHPVRWMSWNDALAYCRWAGKRLPTEAEWEKAARGTSGQVYPWGNTFVEMLVARGDSVAVGSLNNASPYGVYDMAGNVWEWVADWYDPSYYALDPPNTNPPGPGSGVARVLRGGGYNNGADDLRGANRHSGGQEGYAPDHGFRCASTP